MVFSMLFTLLQLEKKKTLWQCGRGEMSEEVVFTDFPAASTWRRGDAKHEKPSTGS